MKEFLEQLDLPGKLPKILSQSVSALIVAVLVLIAYSVVSRALATLERKKKLSPKTIVLLKRIARWVFFPVLVLLVLQQFGVMDNVWALITAALAMVAIGFVAVWSVLSNGFCSVILMVVRPFEVGDTIDVPSDNLRGKVIDFNLMFTTLRDDEGHLIQIPNNLFFQKAVRRQVGQSTVSLDEQADREVPAA